MAGAGASVAVAIVSYNTRELLDRCLRSLEPDVRAGRATAWVVDNGSKDGSVALVRECHPWTQLIEPGENLGFGAAVNLVAQQTFTPWIAPSNADVELEPGALEALLDAGGRLGGAGALAPRLLLGGGETQHSVYPFPTLPFLALFNLGMGWLSAGWADERCLEGRWNPERAREVDWAIGAFLLVRREAWDQAGGFDEAQWMYAEDLDLGWRLRRAGWSTFYQPAARIRHHASAATAAAWGDGRTERWQRATYAWMLRRRGMARTRAAALINVAGAAGRAAGLTPAARARPARFAPARASAARWTRLHARTGLAPRARLESQDVQRKVIHGSSLTSTSGPKSGASR